MFLSICDLNNKQETKMRKSVTGVVARPLRLGAIVSVASACAALFMLPAAQAQAVKSYDSTKKDFWEHPPAD